MENILDHHKISHMLTNRLILYFENSLRSLMIVLAKNFHELSELTPSTMLQDYYAPIEKHHFIDDGLAP